MRSQSSPHNSDGNAIRMKKEKESLPQADKPLEASSPKFWLSLERTRLLDVTLIVSFHISRNCRRRPFDFLSFHVAQY